MLENTVGKGEIAHYEQFLLFPVFSEDWYCRHEKKQGLVWERVNSIPNSKILDWSKFKAFADNKMNGVQTMISISDTDENIVGKRENAGYQHFLLFPRFEKASFSRSSKVWIV